MEYFLVYAESEDEREGFRQAGAWHAMPYNELSNTPANAGTRSLV
jgi:hypothetical protein